MRGLLLIFAVFLALVWDISQNHGYWLRTVWMLMRRAAHVVGVG